MKIQIPFATRVALAGVSAILIHNSPGYAGNDNSGTNAAPPQPQTVSQNAPPQTQIVVQNLVFTHRSFFAQDESLAPTGCIATDVLVQGTFEVNRFAVNGQGASVELNPSAKPPGRSFMTTKSALRTVEIRLRRLVAAAL